MIGHRALSGKRRPRSFSAGRLFPEKDMTYSYGRISIPLLVVATGGELLPALP